MLCYLDKQFCSAFPDKCVNTACDRAVTSTVSERAKKWWGGPDAPIALSDLSSACPARIPPEAVTMPSIYHVPHDRRTSAEPSAGWYVGPLHDDDHPHGPFYDRERAEEWRDERGKLGNEHA